MQSLSARNTAEISSRVFTFLPRSHMAAVGAISAVAAGLLNGSWNLPTKPDAPRLVNAALYWEWEQIWLVANVLIVIFNTFLVLGVVGAGTLGDVYRGASSGELGSICAFSLLWGFGGVGYGQAIKRVGMALGTSIVMAQIVCKAPSSLLGGGHDDAGILVRRRGPARVCGVRDVLEGSSSGTRATRPGRARGSGAAAPASGGGRRGPRQGRLVRRSWSRWRGASRAACHPCQVRSSSAAGWWTTPRRGCQGRLPSGVDAVFHLQLVWPCLLCVLAAQGERHVA